MKHFVKRDTIDLWIVQADYGNDWEEISIEVNKTDAHERIKECRENEPSVKFKIKKVWNLSIENRPHLNERYGI